MSAWQWDEEGYVAYDLHIWYIACMQTRYTHYHVPAYSHQGSFQIDKCAHLNTLYLCLHSKWEIHMQFIFCSRSCQNSG